MNKLVAVEAIVSRTVPVRPRLLEGAFRCRRCGHINRVKQESDRMVRPFECESDTCGKRGPFDLDEDESVQEDRQILKIQERPEDLSGGEQPQSIIAEITENQCGSVLPGNRVVIVAIVRERLVVKGVGETTDFDIVLEVISIKRSEIESKVILTDDDKKRLKDLADHPAIIDILAGNFATSVYGMDEIKEAILLAMVGKGYEIRADGTPWRNFIHIGICGDPGVAKSNLKYAAKKVFPPLSFASGTGSSGVGLTAAAVKDELTGGWSIDSGALVMADGAGLVVDEFDKLHKNEQRAMNDAMSNCQFEVNRAGLNVKLWARCFVICIFNPKDGRFEKYTPLPLQLGVFPDTLSRFDLIFVIQDIPDEKMDSRISHAILRACGIEHSSSGDEEMHLPLVVSAEDLQKYIVYAQTFNPKWSKEAGDYIRKEYLKARKAGSDDKIAITRRHMEALIRLPRAEAQLRLSNLIEVRDVKRAVNLIRASLLQTCLDRNDEIDVDMVATGTNRDMRWVAKTVRETIRSCQKNGTPAEYAEIVLAVEKFRIDRKTLDSYLKHMKDQGDIYEISPGKWRVSN